MLLLSRSAGAQTHVYSQKSTVLRNVERKHSTFFSSVTLSKANTQSGMSEPHHESRHRDQRVRRKQDPAPQANRNFKIRQWRSATNGRQLKRSERAWEGEGRSFAHFGGTSGRQAPIHACTSLNVNAPVSVSVFSGLHARRHKGS